MVVPLKAAEVGILPHVILNHEIIFPPSSSSVSLAVEGKVSHYDPHNKTNLIKLFQFIMTALLCTSLSYLPFPTSNLVALPSPAIPCSLLVLSGILPYPVQNIQTVIFYPAVLFLLPLCLVLFCCLTLPCLFRAMSCLDYRDRG